MTRREAARLGLEQYWPDKPCKRGHSSPRYTRNGVCVQCNAEQGKEWRQAVRQTLEEARARNLEAASA